MGLKKNAQTFGIERLCHAYGTGQFGRMMGIVGDNRDGIVILLGSVPIPEGSVPYDMGFVPCCFGPENLKTPIWEGGNCFRQNGGNGFAGVSPT